MFALKDTSTSLSPYVLFWFTTIFSSKYIFSSNRNSRTSVRMYLLVNLRARAKTINEWMNDYTVKTIHYLCYLQNQSYSLSMVHLLVMVCKRKLWVQVKSNIHIYELLSSKYDFSDNCLYSTNFLFYLSINPIWKPSMRVITINVDSFSSACILLNKFSIFVNNTCKLYPSSQTSPLLLCYMSYHLSSLYGRNLMIDRLFSTFVSFFSSK